MFIQRAFANPDPSRLDQLIAHNPFVALISSEDDGTPLATQLAVLYRRCGDAVHIEGHFARANPQTRHAGRTALLIVHGADAYISASWYSDKIEQACVPTWNYSAAHLYGPLQLIEDEAELCTHLGALSAFFEQRGGSDWRFDPDNPAERVQVRGVVGFRLCPTRIDIKDKLSQNHPVPNRRAVAARLLESGSPCAQRVGQTMRASLPQDGNSD